MPRIPVSAVTVGQSPISGRPLQEIREIGRAVTGLTQASLAFARRRKEEQRGMDLVSGVTDFDSALGDLRLDIQRDPGIFTVEAAEARFMEGSQEISRGVLDNEEDETVRRQLEAYMGRKIVSSRIAVNQSAFRKQVDHNIAEADRSDEQLAQAYVLAPNDEVRAIIRKDQLVRTNLLSGFIGEEAAGNRVRAFAATTDALRVQTLIDNDQADLALELLQDQDELRGLDPVTRQRFEQLTRAKIRGDEAAELGIAVSRGDATEDQIRNAEKRQVISPSEMKTLIKELDRVQAEQAKSSFNLARAAAAFTGDGLPLTPTESDHKAGLDLLYQAFVVPNLAGLNSNQQQTAIASFVSRPGINMLPQSLQSEISGKLRSGTDAQIGEASDLLARIRAETPRALDDMSSEEIGFGMNVARLVEATGDLSKSIEHAKEVEKISELAREILRESFRSTENREVMDQFVDDLIDLPGIFTGDRVLSPQYRGELRNLAEIEFQRNGGNMDLALDLAELQLNKTWADTRVDGGPTRLMKRAPEAMHPEFPGPESLREQLLADVNENATPQLSIESLRLVSDTITARTNPPAYIVEVLQGTGEWSPLLRDGRIKRFQFDFATSPEGLRRREENLESFNSAESTRAMIESSLQKLPLIAPGKLRTQRGGL